MNLAGLSDHGILPVELVIEADSLLGNLPMGFALPHGVERLPAGLRFPCPGEGSIQFDRFPVPISGVLPAVVFREYGVLHQTILTPAGEETKGEGSPEGQAGGGEPVPPNPDEEEKAAKAANPRAAVQRKYSNIYINTGAQPKEEKSGLPAGIGWVRYQKCMMRANKDFDHAAHIARKGYDDAFLERQIKAMSVTSPSDGGYLVPKVYASEVPDEVAALFAECDRREAAYRLRTYRHKAYFSLDCDDGIENKAVFVALSPWEHYERKVTAQELRAALASLPEIQSRRVYSHCVLGISKAELARADGVSRMAVGHSIERGLKAMENFLKNWLF